MRPGLPVLEYIPGPPVRRAQRALLGQLDAAGIPVHVSHPAISALSLPVLICSGFRSASSAVPSGACPAVPGLVGDPPRCSINGVIQWMNIDGLMGTQSQDFDRELITVARSVNTPYTGADTCKREFYIFVEKCDIFYPASSSSYHDRGHLVRGRTLGQWTSDHVAYAVKDLGDSWILSS